MWKGKDYSIHGMSSFLPGPKRCEWDTGESALKPGPGEYEPKSVSKLKLTAAKSSFISATAQHEFGDLGKGPGPCYYKPPELGMEPTRSFLLNSKKRWL